MASTNSSNPFYCDDDDVDDFEFVNNPKQGSGYLLANEKYDKNSEFDVKRQQLLERRREIEESSLRSTQQSLGLMYESEQMGISAADELVRQKEQLQRCEERVDEINSNLTTSQKHLNSIKSVFGGLKNWWGQKSNVNDPGHKLNGAPRTVRPSGTLEAAIERSHLEMSSSDDRQHPAFRARGLDDPAEETPPCSSSRSKQVDQQLEKNLDDISVGIGRLKHLAIGLGDEIDEQDELLERLDTKVEKVDTRIFSQNREMTRILKK